MDIKRVNRGIMIDPRVWEVVQSKEGSASKVIEGILVEHFKSTGDIPEDYEEIGEARGGYRENSGRKSNKV